MRCTGCCLIVEFHDLMRPMTALRSVQEAAAEYRARSAPAV